MHFDPKKSEKNRILCLFPEHKNDIFEKKGRYAREILKNKNQDLEKSPILCLFIDQKMIFFKKNDDIDLHF